MFKDPTITIVNSVLIVGIVLALIAAIKLKKANRELHSKNLAERRRPYGGKEG